MEKKSYPTPRGSAANKAKQKYNKEHYSRVSLNLTKEYHYYLKCLAEESGQSLNAWILRACEDRADHRYDEYNGHDWARLIEWLQSQNMSPTDIVNCIYFTCSGKNLSSSN